MSNLEQPTPEKNVLMWKIGTFLYGLVILVNENLDTIAGLGIPPEWESRIKLAGAVMYFGFTYFHFNKTEGSA